MKRIGEDSKTDNIIEDTIINIEDNKNKKYQLLD
jgi:hypothetical protein